MSLKPLKLLKALLWTGLFIFGNLSVCWALEPDLRILQDSGYIMGPGNGAYPVSDAWKKSVSFMKQVDTFDAIADRIESVICGEEQNKSVLIVGDPSVAYMYLFARMAGPRPESNCPAGMWHVQLNIGKIEAGNKYVGDIEQYWIEKVLSPADRKNVVLYLDAIGMLVGLGSHSNDETGIEREYVANITAGRLRSVAFIDKYEYNEMIRSRNSYVLESFGEKIILPPVESDQVFKMAQTYMKVLYPSLTITDKDLQFVVKNIAYYQPNRNEPDRTFSVLNTLIRDFGSQRGSKPVEKIVKVESEHPYPSKAMSEYFIEQPEFDALQLEFDLFDFEDGYDYLEVFDAKTNISLMRYTGTMTPGTRTIYFGTNKIRLLLVSDASGTNQGFKISKVFGKKMGDHIFTREEVRRSVMAVAQVPQWLVDRDFSVIKNLEGNLNGDVVGVAEGKKDLVRLAKNGYVAGRTDDKPVATILLTGPTGTGKSYVAKKMADFTQLKLITLDMTNYKDVSSFKSFQEVMTRNLTNNPYAVYLFEEIDKASIEVLDQLYFMMDEGVFYDAYQRPLFARGAFIIMTTNAASDVILKDPNNPNLRSIVMEDLRKSFRMSFINRFDAISIFKPFTDPEFHQLANTLVSKKIAKIKDVFEWDLSVDAGTLEFIATFGRSAEFGARPMERLVENTLGIGIAEYQLAQGNIPELATIKIQKLTGANNFKIDVNGNAMEYVVDTTHNGWLLRLPIVDDRANSIFKFFKKNRLYND